MTSSRTGEEQSTPSSPLAHDALVGEYRVDRQIGQGGMGIVYSAIHPVIGKRAAIKILRSELADPRTIARFVDEARVVNQIGHPNIVDIFAFGQLDDGRHYFVMEWLQGMSLRERLLLGRIPLADVCAIVRSLARALEAVHAHGIVHRDLKPDNVFLVDVANDAPIVKLLDFGIAKLTVTEARLDQTASGVLIGTPQYIAPEQARGLSIDHRADIYALGCLMFELLTGRVVFVGETAMEVMAKHITEAPRLPSLFATGVPPELDAIVLAMLAKDADARPSLAALIGTVDRIGRMETLRVSQPTITFDAQPIATPTPPPPPERSRRWLRVAIATSIIAVGAVAFAIVSTLPLKSTPPPASVPTMVTAPVVIDPPQPHVATPPAPIPPPASIPDLTPIPTPVPTPVPVEPITKPHRSHGPTPHASTPRDAATPRSTNSDDDDATMHPSTTP